MELKSIFSCKKIALRNSTTSNAKKLKNTVFIFSKESGIVNANQCKRGMLEGECKPHGHGLLRLSNSTLAILRTERAPILFS
ncbi:MAG: hypothetical protein WCK00_05375 [Deltaproteobacteria bacterium]